MHVGATGVPNGGNHVVVADQCECWLAGLALSFFPSQLFPLFALGLIIENGGENGATLSKSFTYNEDHVADWTVDFSDKFQRREGRRTAVAIAICARRANKSNSEFSG